MNRLLSKLPALLVPFVAGAVAALFLFQPEAPPVKNETVVKVYRKQIVRTEKKLAATAKQSKRFKRLEKTWVKKESAIVREIARLEAKAKTVSVRRKKLERRLELLDLRENKDA
jgi:predicted  nucleic acid-binding Zn-ribbon protein